MVVVLTAAGHAIDVVLDVIGGEILERSASLVRPGGTFISTNYALDPGLLAARDIRAVNLGNNPTAEVLTTLADLAATGALRVRIDAEVSLDKAPTAVAQARVGHARGKTVIIL